MEQQIKFKSVSLLNFKRFRNETFGFGDNVTVIKGRNASGKSTIVDAILYCLFGVNSQGLSKFGLKTRNENGEEIRDLTHEVKLVLSINGDDLELRRVLTESTKGESVTNTYSYFIDGQNVTAKDYDKAVGDIVCQSQNLFTFCISPTAFVSQSWDKQRTLLTSLIGDVSPNEITHGDSRYDFILKEIEKKGIEDIVKHCKYVKNEIQKELDKIPTRLGELEKALPIVDSEALPTIEDINKELEELAKQLNEIKNGGSDKVMKDSIRHKIEFAQKRKDNMEKSARNEANSLADKYDADLQHAYALMNDAEKLVNDLRNKKNSFDIMIRKCKERIEECEKEKLEGSEQWKKITARKWEWNEDMSFCPSCGQPLPPDKLSELMQKSKELFNKTIAREKEKCIETASAINNLIKEAKENIDSFSEELDTTDRQLVEAQKTLSEKENAYKELRENTPATYLEKLAEKTEYNLVCKEIEDLQQQLDVSYTNTVNTELINEIEVKLEKAKETQAAIYKEQAKQKEYDHIQELIENVKKDKRTYLIQLDEAESRLDAAMKFYVGSCKVLEDKINSMFSYVKWSMFRTNLDGTKKPFCECSHNGIPFSDLNTADKINAGLDICHTIAKCYNVQTPVIIDNTESITNPLYFGGQQIRLYVSDEYDELHFEYED